jgi:hypothetical protein
MLPFGVMGLLLVGCTKPDRSDVSTPVAPTAAQASRSIESFRFIGPTTTIQQVIAELGAPDRNVGSGVYIYEYRLNDGTRVWIWSADNTHIGFVRYGGTNITNIGDGKILYERK